MKRTKVKSIMKRAAAVVIALSITCSGLSLDGLHTSAETMPEETQGIEIANDSETALSLYNAMQKSVPILSCGFEDGANAWNLNSKAEVTKEDKASGSASLKMTTGGNAEGSSWLNVEPGSTYAVNLKLKAKGTPQAVVLVYQMDAEGNVLTDGNTVGYVKAFTEDSDGWISVAFDWKVKEEANRIRVDLMQNDGTGTTYWDDITVTQKAAPQAGDVLLENGFEEGAGGWTLSGGAEVSDEQSVSGSYSLKMPNGGYAEGAWTNVEAGKTYTVKVKLNGSDETQGVVYIYEMDESGNVLNVADAIVHVKDYGTDTNGWQTIKFNYTVSSTTSSIRLDFQNNMGTDVCWWDDVSVALKAADSGNDGGSGESGGNGNGGGSGESGGNGNGGGSGESGGNGNGGSNTEVVFDGTFENGTNGWKLSGGAEITTKVKCSGKASLKTVNGSYAEGVWQDSKPATKYTVELKLKAKEDAQCVVFIYEMDADGNVLNVSSCIAYVFAPGSGNNKWQKISFDYETMEETAKIRVDLQQNVGESPSYWDDITVAKKVVKPGEQEKEYKVDKEPKKNLLYNGTFGKDTKSWTMTKSSVKAEYGVVDSKDEKHGKVLETKLSAEKEQVYFWSEEVDVKANYIYTISYQVKMDVATNSYPYGCIPIIQELNSEGVYNAMPQTDVALNGTDGWQTVTYEYITGKKAQKIRIDLMFANVAGTAWWDNVTITEKKAYVPVVLNKKYDHGGTTATKNKKNVIQNGTFDGGDASGWNLNSGIKAYETANKNGGVLKFEVAPGRYFQSNQMMVQGESIYELTYYVLAENTKNLDFISYFFYNEGENWNDCIAYNVTEDTNGFQKVTITFATPKLKKGDTLTVGFKALHSQECGTQKGKACSCTSEGIVYLDDISLIRTGEYLDVGEGRTSEDSVIYNGTFERYAADENNVDGWDLNKANTNHKTILQSEVVHEGKQALKIKATGHSYIWAQDFTVETGKIYILSYWVKVDSAEGLKFAPYMNDGNYSGGWWLDDAVQPVYETTDGWVQMMGAVSIPASVGENTNNPGSKIQLGFQVYEGAGVIYLDDVSMVPTDIDAENPNLDFELDSKILYNWTFASYNGGNGNAKTSDEVRPGSDGKVSALITNVGAGESIFVSKILEVEPNTTYEFTYWTKQTGSYDSLSIQVFRQLQADGVTEAMSDTWNGNTQAVEESAMISPFWTYQVQGEVDWRQIGLSFITGADTKFIEIRFLVQGENTQTLFDDVTLTKAASTANLDFETTSSVTGAPQNWYMSMVRSQEVVFESDSTMYHSGGQSLHLIKDTLSEKTVVDSAAFIPVSSDNIYEFSFWVNSRNASPSATIRMNLQLYRADGSRIYKTDGNYETMLGTVSSLNNGEEAGGWTKVTTRSAPVAEAAYATISFTITRGYAEVWIDDIFCNVVENETDCVVYYSDFHAVDQDGKLGEWDLDTIAGEAGWHKTTDGVQMVISEGGESYLKNEMKCIMTDYTYCLKGNYSSAIGGTVQVRFYDYKHEEYEDLRETIPIVSGGSEFELTFTAPSNSYASIYIGSDQAGAIDMKDVTVYMTAKPADSSDWDGFWVWYPEDPVKEAVEQYRYFRYTFTLENDAEYAPLQLTVDDKYALYVNGELIDENWDAGTDSWANVGSYDLTDKVHKGENVIALKCYNLVSEAGVLFDGKFTLKDKSVVVVASSSDVVSSKTANDDTLDWTQLAYDDSSWTECREYGQPPCSPWGPVFYNSSLYISNAAQIISTEVPEKVTAGKKLEFTVTMKLDDPIESKFSPVVTIYKRNSITSITSTPMTFETNSNPLEWPVGEEFEVECSIEIPDYMESGKYTLQMDSNTLLLSGDDVYDNKFVSFQVQSSSSGRDNVVSSIEVYNGTPTLMIDGEPQAAQFYLRPDLNVYLQTDAETRMYKSDLELYITYGGSLYKGGCDPIWLEDGSIDYDAFDAPIYEALASNSNALVMVNIGMFAPQWWLEQNPDEEVLAYNGSDYIQMSDVSLASEKFREEAGEVLRQLIQHMKEQSYYNRVYGLKITGGQTYEWFCWGTGTNQGPDYSKTSQEGFKKYLKEKYGTEEALQEAWGNSSVTFETAAAPGWNERGESENVYMGSGTTGLSRNMVDWNLWLNEASADSFLYYCQIAKEETDNQLIVGGYNGYLWTSNSYDSQGMAHTAMDRVLDSEYVDWISSPIAYNERLLGESNTYMALLDSVQEHGKLYIAEQDNRTCLSSVYAGASWDADWDYQVGQTRTLADTVLQQKRDFANALVNGAGLWQYDMYGGWLDDDQIYDYLSDAKAEYDFSVYVDRNQRNEVAVFVGDETYAYMTADDETNMPYALFEPLLMQQRKQLAAMGCGYDTYAMSSLLEGKVSDHKLNIILSPFEITEEMQEAIDTYLKKNGQYVVWVYLPGISDGTKLDTSNIKRATGFDIGIIEEKAGLQVKITDTGNPLTEGIDGLIYGNSQPNYVSPLTYIRDTSGSIVLGYNMDEGGLAGLAVKDMGEWTSVYSAAPCLDVELLRNLLKASGCHIYSENNEDVIYSNNHYVALHSAAAGEKTITLPGNYSVYDVFEEEFVSMDTNTITYYHEANETHIFRLMTPNTYAVTARLKSGKGTLSAPGLTEVAPGEGYELTVTPEEGYELSEVVVNGESVELTDNTFKLAEVNENQVIEVRFSKLPELVEVIDILEELIILPWWAFFTGLAVVILLGIGGWQLVRIRKRKKEQEEGGR